MRLDIYLNNEFNTGREKAKELIKTENVLVNNEVVTKPAFEITENDEVKILDEDFDKYVSRGAYKLIQAIDEFDLKVDGKKCLDVGASTGGFTDVLIQSNAEKVYAVDTGTSQLHEKLKQNNKIISLENTNILDIKEDDYGLFDIVTVDVSFVSITKIIPHLVNLMNTDCQCVFLVKPQFEVGKNKLNKKGVVKNPKDRETALNDVVNLCRNLGFRNIKSTISNTVGHSGNIEFLLSCTRG